jgi:hypothetical protein
MRRRPAWYRPAPPPADDADEPAQPPEPAEEPVSADEPTDAAPAEPSAEPIAEPVAGDDTPAGGEEELGAWIRRAAAAAIGAVSKPTAPSQTATSAGKPALHVIQGGGGGGGGGSGGGGGGGRRDPIRAILNRAKLSVNAARVEAQQKFNLDAAMGALNSARLSLAAGATLTGAHEYFAPLQNAILRAQSGRFSIRPRFLNSTSVQPYVDVINGLVGLIDGMIRRRPSFRT